MVGRTQLKGSWRCWSRSTPQSSVMAAAEARGMVCYGLVNVFGSTLAKVASLCLPLCCGYEISVPATKTFTNQVITSLFLACRMARRDTKELDAIPGLMQTAIDATAPPAKAIACEINDWDDMCGLGYGYTYPMALEGALKMKEIPTLTPRACSRPSSSTACLRR